MIIKAVHLLLLPIAATFGWYVGKQDRNYSNTQELRRDYLRGLNYLISEQSDKAVDVFIKLLEVDSDTVEIYLALGHLFRRRGEVDRAIRIHQNLIERPQLEKRHHVQALFALGQDYLYAGVLDRAEQVFLELIKLEEGSHQKKQDSLRFLLRIYQQEKDWRKAIDITTRLASETEDATEILTAQFYCELAEQEAQAGRVTEALQYLQQAIHKDAHCVRANIIGGSLAFRENRYPEAIMFYKQVKEQNIHFIPEIIEPLCLSYLKLGEEAQLIPYLQECLQDYPNISLVLTVSEYLRKYQSHDAAIAFISEQVQREPSMRGINRIVTMYLSHSHDQTSDKLLMLQSFIQQVLADKPSYQCSHCGFAAKILFWYCPSCHNWSTIRPIHIVGGIS